MGEDGFSYEYYKDDIARYIDYYRRKIYEIDERLKKLQLDKKVSEDIRIEGRIKSYKSLLSNYNNGKNIEDCFGLKIITSNKSEIKQIEDNILDDMFENYKKKKHFLILTTKYNATHLVVWPKEHEENFTLIEIQLCTKEEERKNNEGANAHDIYKLGSKIAVEQQYSLLMDLDEEKRKQYLPRYFVVEDGEIKVLDEEQTIRKMYPTIFADKKEKLVPVEKSFKESIIVELDKMTENFNFTANEGKENPDSKVNSEIAIDTGKEDI